MFVPSIDPEAIGPYILAVGAFLAVTGYVWLIVRAFRAKTSWGLISLIPPLGLAFLPANWKRARLPALVILAGVLTAAVPFGWNYYLRHFVSLGPREKLVDGELHVTLTGWDGKDYSILRARPRTVVLQMANGDVDDATLANLRGMTELRELDLSDTGVSDAGLPLLARLPRLERLRLRKTRITDEGFKTHLAPMSSLMEVDLRGTKVAPGTVRAWREGKPDRRALR